jgi:transposase
MFKQQYNGEKIRKAILLYEKIRSFRKVAYILNISKSSIHRWYNRFHKVLSPSRPKYYKRKRKYKFETLIDDL